MTEPDRAPRSRSTVEKWTPERRRARTRATLVEAARLVFARKGFEGASLDEIAESADYTRGAIYKHFDGKEDLLFAVFDHMNEQVLDAFSDLIEFNGNAAMDPTTIVEVWKRLFADDPDARALDLEFRLYELRHPSVRDRASAHRRQTRELIIDFMAEHSEAAGIAFVVPLESLTSILLITSDAFSLAAQLDPEAAQLYQQFLELFLPTVLTDRDPNPRS